MPTIGKCDASEVVILIELKSCLFTLEEGELEKQHVSLWPTHTFFFRGAIFGRDAWIFLESVR